MKLLESSVENAIEEYKKTPEFGVKIRSDKTCISATTTM